MLGKETTARLERNDELIYGSDASERQRCRRAAVESYVTLPFHLQMQNNFTTLFRFTTEVNHFLLLFAPHNLSINCDFTPSACICITFSPLVFRWRERSLFKYFSFFSCLSFHDGQKLPSSNSRDARCYSNTLLARWWWSNNEETLNWCNIFTQEAFIAFSPKPFLLSIISKS